MKSVNVTCLVGRKLPILKACEVYLLSSTDDEDDGEEEQAAEAPAATAVEPWPPTWVSALGDIFESLAAHEEARILMLPHAQKTCGRAKKTVYVDRDFVYKGPYTPGERSLEMNLLRVRQVLLLQRLSGVAPTVLCWSKVHTIEQRVYLAMVNVAKAPVAADFTVESTVIETDVSIMKRGAHVSRVSEVESTLPSPLLARCLEHLVACFLVNAGDHGTHNILLTAAGDVVGMDLEETRMISKVTEDSTHPLDVLFEKGASQAQRQLYTPVLPLVRFRTVPLSAAEATQVAAVGLDPSIINQRLRLLVAMMARHRPSP